MENEFSTLDIVKALQIPRERLRDWMNRSFIEPSVFAEGQGTKAIFTLHDVYGVALFQALIDNGFGRETSSRFVKDFIRQEREKREKTFRETDYILFRVPADKKEVTYVIDLPAFEDIKRYAPIINLESGLVETGSSKEYRASEEPVEIFAESAPKEGGWTKIKAKWSFLHVVNYKGIREKVDEALKKL